MTTENLDKLLDAIIEGRNHSETQGPSQSQEWTSSSVSLTAVGCILVLLVAAVILVILLHQKYNKSQRTESERDFLRRLRCWVMNTESQQLWKYGKNIYPDESHYTRVKRKGSHSEEYLRSKEIPARYCKSTPDASRPDLVSTFNKNSSPIPVLDLLTFQSAPNPSVCTVDACTSTEDQDEGVVPRAVDTTSLEHDTRASVPRPGPSTGTPPEDHDKTVDLNNVTTYIHDLVMGKLTTNR